MLMAFATPRGKVTANILFFKNCNSFLSYHSHWSDFSEIIFCLFTPYKHSALTVHLSLLSAHFVLKGWKFKQRTE